MHDERIQEPLMVHTVAIPMPQVKRNIVEVTSSLSVWIVFFFWSGLELDGDGGDDARREIPGIVPRTLKLTSVVGDMDSDETNIQPTTNQQHHYTPG